MVGGERVTVVHTAADGTISYGSGAVQRGEDGFVLGDVRDHQGKPLVLYPNESIQAVVECELTIEEIPDT